MDPDGFRNLFTEDGVFYNKAGAVVPGRWARHGGHDDERMVLGRAPKSSRGATRVLLAQVSAYPDLWKAVSEPNLAG